MRARGGLFWCRLPGNKWVRAQPFGGSYTAVSRVPFPGGTSRSTLVGSRLLRLVNGDTALQLRISNSTQGSHIWCGSAHGFVQRETVPPAHRHPTPSAKLP